MCRVVPVDSRMHSQPRLEHVLRQPSDSFMSPLILAALCGVGCGTSAFLDRHFVCTLQCHLLTHLCSLFLDQTLLVGATWPACVRAHVNNGTEWEESSQEGNLQTKLRIWAFPEVFPLCSISLGHFGSSSAGGILRYSHSSCCFQGLYVGEGKSFLDPGLCGQQCRLKQSCPESGDWPQSPCSRLEPPSVFPRSASAKPSPLALSSLGLPTQACRQHGFTGPREPLPLSSTM